jgi:hypothetical protein
MTFHVDPNKVAAVMRTLDETIARLSAQDGFKGLLCLEMGGGARQRIHDHQSVGTGGPEATAWDVEEVREHVVATLDLGATIQTHEVVRLQPHLAQQNARTDVGVTPEQVTPQPRPGRKRLSPV